MYLYSINNNIINNIEYDKIINISFRNDSIKEYFIKNDIKIIRRFLKKQKYINASKFIVSKVIINSEKKGLGLYYIETRNLKIKSSKVIIPLLKFDSTISLNINYERGKFLGGDSILIKNNIRYFQEKYKNSFSENDLKEITSQYLFGIFDIPVNNVDFLH